MAPSCNTSAALDAVLAHRRPRRRADRSGKIALVTIFALLGMLVMAGFIGNVGHVTTNKIATQNGADAIAFSSAQWMARGMNAATATNHMLGEVTGLVVVIEGLAGPESYTDGGGMELYTPQNKTLDSINRVLKELAPAGADTPGIYGEKALGEVEKPLLKVLTDSMVPENDDDGKSKAWATIYDSKLELKMDLSKWLLAKTIANLGFFVPPPWGYISAGIAYVVHIGADTQLALIAKEWFILEGLEFIVKNQLVKQLKGKVETLLVPALAKHGDFIAGRLNKKGNSKPQAASGIVNVAVNDSLTHLGKVYKLDAFTFPVAKNILMPIEAEPGPSMKGTPRGKDEKEWGKDEVVTLPDADSALADIQENISDSKSEIQNRMARLRERIALMDRLEADVNKLSQEESVQPEEKKSFDDEKKEINRARTAMKKRLADLEDQMKKLNKKQDQLNQTLSQIKSIGDSSGNLSAKRTHLALEDRQNKTQMSQAEERYTQWVRASFPYVDSFRAPVLKMFNEGLFNLRRSEAGKHYEKWTNRYTLTKSWGFRSGFRFIKVGETDAEWQKKEDPLEMYVMKGAYNRQQNTGARRDQKGQETWTESTPTGKNQAEEMFTVIGLTHHQIKPLFSPVIYPSGSRLGTTTIAQAVFYNANEQKPAATTGSTAPTQAKVGWDTLNWDPTTSAPEWGNKLANSSAKWPWQIFSPAPGDDFSSSAKVKLNWQAKLMPLTKSRLNGAKKMPMSMEMNLNVGGAVKAFDPLVTH